MSPFYGFGISMGSMMCAKPCPYHWWENAWPIEPNMMSLLCDDWYCVNVVGQASGLEKYECVSLNLLMSLFSMVSGKAMWLCMRGIVCGE